ncbi:DUF4167 domain-containing protein [Azospirillum canadense]|uniref:DUF4167 domain-containing protein n=1 Tax=Azospirillum canadense TaxID=403962 RepID=UPI00222647F4|nr:DUF4167 domain-containing protein [Azospirillum canadense]
MSPSKPSGGRAPRPHYGKARPHAGGAQGVVRPAPRVSGSAQQKHAQWLARATDAERSGDAVEAELCRQYAEHWFRVLQGQD